MSNAYLNKITNDFQAVRLISLASWRQAAEINPRDRNGPYVVVQEGYDPEDMKMLADEFVLGRSGKWVSLSYFYKMPVPERREEFIFGTAAEVMQVLEDLPSKPAVLRPGHVEPEPVAAGQEDDLAAAFKAARGQAAGPGQASKSQ